MFSRRAVWWMIFAGVFERHPGLKLVITETPGNWYPPTATELDTLHAFYDSKRDEPLNKALLDQVPRRPSEYMANNVYFGASFASPYEVEQARLHGLEWSWPLRIACAWRCRAAQIDARVRRGDIWAADWSGYDLVYVFQRPESMARAADKAMRELRAGSWLASLEFAVPGVAPTHRLECADGRPLWLYRAPFGPRR